MLKLSIHCSSSYITRQKFDVATASFDISMETAFLHAGQVKFRLFDRIRSLFSSSFLEQH